MPAGRQPIVTLETNSFGGLNNALQFSQIPREQSPSMQNAYMNKVGDLSKRPGSIPVTTAALASPIQHILVYYNKNDVDSLLVSSGTSLYKFNDVDTLTAVTGTLNKADIYTVAFTDATNNSRLLITDGSTLKQYDGTSITNVNAAADDPSPNPPNDLTNINTKNPLYIWVYSSHVFMSDGKDIAWYSKRFTFDYWPSVQFERWVRENDYITGPGVSFNNVCLIPMRRGWGMLTGSTIDDFSGNNFINTINGCIAPRSIQKVTYPTGLQTVVYLSDDGAHEIYDTGAIDAGSRQYATKSLMKDKVDFNALGLTEAEKKAAVAYYDNTLNLYILCFKQGANELAYCYDVRNGNWYPFTNIKALSMVRYDGILYFAGSDGLLKKFDENLYSDWNDTAKTSGTPVHLKRYSPAIAFEFSGYQSYLDSYLLEAKQWSVPSTLDITIVCSETTVELQDALLNQVFTWSNAQWGKAKWTNVNYTDLVNEPNEILLHKKGKYFQVLIENDRDEPVTIYRERFKGRLSGR